MEMMVSSNSNVKSNARAQLSTTGPNVSSGNGPHGVERLAIMALISTGTVIPVMRSCQYHIMARATNSDDCQGRVVSCVREIVNQLLGSFVQITTP